MPRKKLINGPLRNDDERCPRNLSRDIKPSDSRMIMGDVEAQKIAALASVTYRVSISSTFTERPKSIVSALSARWARSEPRPTTGVEIQSP